MGQLASLVIRLEGDVAQLQSSLDRANDTLDKVSSHAERAGSSIKTALATAAGVVVGGALERLPGVLMDSVKAATEDEASQARLRQAVENTGSSYAAYAAQIDQVIKKGQNLGFTDDQTRSALAILTAQTNSAEEAQRRYAIAQDLARGANIDVVTSSRLLGKVTDDNVSALSRYGISVQKGATETELFAAIQQKFSGQAAAFADSTAGKYASLGDEVHELQESFGHLLIPIADKSIPALTYSLNGWALAAHGAGDGFEYAAGKLSHLLSQATGIKDKSSPLGFMDLTPEQRKAWDDQTAAIDKQADHLLQLPPLQEAVTADQMNSIRASNAQAKATEAAYTALANSANPQDQAIARTHAQELADQAASKAKSEASAAASEYAKTLPGMIDAEYKDADAKSMQAVAERIYNEQMGIATDLEGRALPSMAELVNQQLDSIDASKRQADATRLAYQARGIATDLEGQAIPTMQELVNQQLDSVEASIRQSLAAQQVANQDFPRLVEQEKQSILASQAMAKATDEANKELGIQTDLLQANTAAWHAQTDAESQSAAAANRTALAASQPYSAAAKALTASTAVSGGTTASAGGSVAFFSHESGLDYVPYDNYPALLHKGERVQTAAEARNATDNSKRLNIYGSVHIHQDRSSQDSSLADLMLARLN